MTTVARADVVIVTSYDYPPIPIRSFDWNATFDDYDGAPDGGHQCSGSSYTELGAVEELYSDYEDWFGDVGDPISNPLCAHRPMFREDLSDDNDDLIEQYVVRNHEPLPIAYICAAEMQDSDL